MITARKSTVAVVAVAGSIAAAAPARAAPPDLSGNYKCEPNPLPCLWTGQAPISQSGANLVIKNDKGEVAGAKFTSDSTISAGGPLNSLGIVRPDHSIDWSNGNLWRKQ